MQFPFVIPAIIFQENRDSRTRSTDDWFSAWLTWANNAIRTNAPNIRSIPKHTSQNLWPISNALLFIFEAFTHQTTHAYWTLFRKSTTIAAHLYSFCFNSHIAAFFNGELCAHYRWFKGCWYRFTFAHTLRPSKLLRACNVEPHWLVRCSSTRYQQQHIIIFWFSCKLMNFISSS